MKHIAGWFRRNSSLVAQAKERDEQLQEAWDDKDGLILAHADAMDVYFSLRDQLHRVARERDEEREGRLDAERLLEEEGYIRQSAQASRRELVEISASQSNAYDIVCEQARRAEGELNEERDSRLAAEAALADVLEDLPNEEE